LSGALQRARQHQRVTVADQQLHEERIPALRAGQGSPEFHHFIA